jgi:hypothetical protein
MNTIRELTDADLDRVSGGWTYCPLGTTKGGEPGLYVDGAPCAGATLVQVTVSAVIAGAKKAAGQPQ